MFKDEPSLPDSKTYEDPNRKDAKTMSSSDYYFETSSCLFDPNKISAPHLRIGKYVRVKVKILRVRNLDKNCANILLQNRFLYENQDPYSSNIYTNDGESCEVNHLHVYRIKVSKSIDVTCTYPEFRLLAMNCFSLGNTYKFGSPYLRQIFCPDRSADQKISVRMQICI